MHWDVWSSGHTARLCRIGNVWLFGQCAGGYGRVHFEILLVFQIHSFTRFRMSWFKMNAFVCVNPNCLHALWISLAKADRYANSAWVLWCIGVLRRRTWYVYYQSKVKEMDDNDIGLLGMKRYMVCFTGAYTFQSQASWQPLPAETLFLRVST